MQPIYKKEGYYRNFDQKLENGVDFVDIKEEKIFYDSTDNVKLCGILTKANLDYPIIIMCHGIRGNKNERGSFEYLSNELQKSGYNSFRLDFRGHGESTGIDYEMTITKEIQDVQSTINMLIGKGYKEFILLGASFGASIVSLMDYSKLDCVKGLVLWYGVFDYEYVKYGDYFSKENKEIAEKQGYYVSKSVSTGKDFRFGKELFDEIDKFKPYEEIQKNDFPKLFVHGKIDSVIPYTLSEDVSKKCNNSKLALIEDGNHTFDNSKKALQEAVNATLDFIKKLI